MQTHLNVILMSCTPGAVDLIHAAYRQCYSDKQPGELMGEAWDMPIGKKLELILSCIESGHDSQLEHVVFTFGISGVSRALTHQLVRHRIASYGQQSQRYVNAKGFDFIMPPKVFAIQAARERFEQAMRDAANAYEEIQEILVRNGYEKTANEDARFVLPNACETRIIATFNIRSLYNFFRLRCCRRAQWEIREMANKMLGLCRAAAPDLFMGAGPACEVTGKCPEGRFSCGLVTTND